MQTWACRAGAWVGAGDTALGLWGFGAGAAGLGLGLQGWFVGRGWSNGAGDAGLGLGIQA